MQTFFQSKRVILGKRRCSGLRARRVLGLDICFSDFKGITTSARENEFNFLFRLLSEIESSSKTAAGGIFLMVADGFFVDGYREIGRAFS